MIWSYPRGEGLSKDGETAIDVGAYAAQIAALLGAHIIKIKLSSEHLEQPEAAAVYKDEKIAIATQADRVAHCMQAAFNGRRIVVFSGGQRKARIVFLMMRGRFWRVGQWLYHRAQYVSKAKGGGSGDVKADNWDLFVGGGFCVYRAFCRGQLNLPDQNKNMQKPIHKSFGCKTCDLS